MTTIYLDTNIVINESFFYSPMSQAFLKACGWLKISVVVPDIVMDEVKGRFPKTLLDKSIALQKAEKDLLKLVKIEPTSLSINDLVEEFSNFLIDLVDETGVIVAPYPEVSPKQIVEKSYEGGKPFKEGGEGYKDYIVWETIKSHILGGATTKPHIFVTNNTKDFCQSVDNSKYVLHSDLENQFEDKSLIPEIQTSMKGALDSQIMPLLEGMDLNDIPELSHDDIEGMTNSILLDELPQRTAFGFENVPFSNDVSISSVGEANIDSVGLAKADGQVIITVLGSVEIEVDGFVDKFEMYANEGKSNYFVWDSNWNDHVAAVSTSVETKFELRLFYSLEDKKVIGHEVDLPQETDDPWPYK